MYRLSNLLRFSLFIALFFMGVSTSAVYAQNIPAKTATAKVTQESIISAELAVSGMTCQMGCADGIDRKLKKTAGIISSSTKLESGICKVSFDKTKISLPEIIQIIKDRGYEAKDVTKKS
ncbi:MAG TPA: heavy metal-associated domain-containing protein [Saprospiraceae bacterium]|nr:heavy-metal-associated domain-containing protein [Saprospiraceae bacterium]HRO08999.1 heavy metal-associated domain-containing protein [Saprospiraceae bacterium]HRP42267.1 heavy metal-associated domain-containing protein [Saprospiraceae bacterium]